MLLPKKACLAVRRGYFSPPVVIILALITLAVAFVIYFNRDLILKTKKDQSTQQSSILSSPTPTPDETVYTDEGSANWKTFTDKKGRFTFKYPSDFSLKEDVGGSGNVFYTDIKNVQEEFRFEVGPKDYVGNFERLKTNKIENINGIPWIVVVASSEYCDAGECGTTAPGYYIMRSDYYVGVSEFKKTESSQTFDQILSTFQFLN